MSLSAPDQEHKLFPSDDVWQRYRRNLPRFCIGVSRHLQTKLMHRLTEELGHSSLRLNYEPFITLVGEQGARLTELAEWLAISKQACNQTVNQLEKEGYLTRRPDPEDGRAKLVVLTEAGTELVAQGSALIGEVESEFAGLIGESEVAELISLGGKLYLGLQLPEVRVRNVAIEDVNVLGGVLPRLSDYMMQRLMELTGAKGHPDLKMSYSQVLSLIGPDGGRIQQMARVQEVSKQAVSAVARELEELGYLYRQSDPQDNRQILLKLTSRGQELISDSVDSIADLEAELISISDESILNRFNELVARLYAALHLEEEVFAELSGSADVDLQLLAIKLKRQLGREAATELAYLLMGN